MRQLRTVSHGTSCFSLIGTPNLALIAVGKKYQSESQSAPAGRWGRMSVCEEILAGNKTTFTGGKRSRRQGETNYDDDDDSNTITPICQ